MWHIVQPGDSLSRISHRFNVPVEALVEANQIHNGTIYIGQQLFIPPDARVRLTYTVKPGDTLDSIARQFGTTKQAIMQANGLDSDFVVPGRVLTIPGRYNLPKQSVVPNYQTSETVSPEQRLTYTVKPGDTLDSIARQFGTTKQTIMQANGLDSDFVVPGRVLTIPGRYNLPKQSVVPNYQTSETVSPKLSLPTEYSMRPTIRYKVEIGNTLDSIAAKFDTTKQVIMQLNGLASENIRAGQILTINTKVTAMQHPTDQRPSSPTIAPYKIKESTFHDNGLQATITIWKAASKKEPTYFFVSKMAVTAAGDPKAYHQNNDLALDFLSTAGIEGYWWGLVTDPSGNPIMQGDKDPAPGYYISKTALSDCKKPVTDPTRYLNATEIPYIALPARHMMGAKIGDLAAVINTMNGKVVYAIVGDVGPDDSLGIGSIALAEELGVLANPKIGGTEDGILYIIFAQSGENACTPKTSEQIKKRGTELFEKWGGMKQVRTLYDKFPLTYKATE